MIKSINIKRRLLFSYLMIGISNLLFISLFIYIVYSNQSLADLQYFEVGGKIFDDILIVSVSLFFINSVFSIFFTRSLSKEVQGLSLEILKLNNQKERQSYDTAIQVMKVQEDEREKLSFTLHDSVGQYLTVLRWGLSNLKLRSTGDKEPYENLLKTCDDIIHEIRSISHDLMPTLIKDFGCCFAIKDYFEKQKQIVPLKMNFEYAPEIEKIQFRKEFDINLYRMIQEFFHNTLKHANATEISTNLKIKNNKLELSYYDDGIGMDTRLPLPTSLSYRARLFNGEMLRINVEKGLAFKVTFNVKDISNATN